jgi:hypothetical protein
MKREIKFRAWDSFAEKMIQPCGYCPPNFPSCGESVIIFNAFGVPEIHECMGRYKVMQFIGIKDIINGKDIYKNDIIELADGSRGVVKFENGSFFHTATTSINGLLYWNKVIGNIYKNPELLKP